jgi:hypothetical protein
VFIFPFFILGTIQLQRRQKIALCGVFSLGLITIVMSLTRFIKVAFATSDSYIDDATGSKFTAERIDTLRMDLYIRD